MTRWDDNQPKNGSPLKSILPALDPIDTSSERVKSPSACSTTVSSTSRCTNGTATTSASCSTSTSTYTSTDEVSSSQVLCNGHADGGVPSPTPENASSSNGTEAEIPSSSSDGGRCRDVIGTPIPLPSPPVSTISIGSACGGNQSYVESGSETRLIGLYERSTSPPAYLNGTFGPSMDTSTSSMSSSSRLAGVVGLHNLGNTCFMNSGLQCLINTPPVVEFFLKSATINGIASPNTALVLQFQSLIRNAWLKPEPSLHLQDFKNVLGNLYSQFKDSRQHDCQEFLALTLDVLHEQLKGWNGSKRGKESNAFNAGPSGTTSSDTSSGVSSAAGSDTEVSSSQKSPEESERSPLNCEGSPQTKRRRVSTATDDTTEMIAPACDVEIKNEPSHENSSPVLLREPSPQEDSLVIDELNTDGEKTPLNETLINGNISEDEIDVGIDALTQIINDESNHSRVNEELLEEQAKEGEEFWRKYIQENNTVIASSFQGMYKSTVTCSVCNYVSKMYEPFMYLSLPIPRTMERQFAVTFSSVKDPRAKKVDVTIDAEETVGKLKEVVLEKIFNGLEWGIPLTVFVVAEVVNYHVFRILDDSASLKTVHDGSRNIYVYELNQDFDDESSSLLYGPFPEDNGLCADAFHQPELLHPTTYLEEDWETDTSSLAPHTATYLTSSSQSSYSNLAETGISFIGQGFDDPSASNGTEPSNSIEWLPCAVCLEDFSKSNLRQHYGCACILCIECMKKTAAHFATSESEVIVDDKSTRLKCPVCADIVEYDKCFISLVETSEGSPKKLHLIPLLFRFDPDKDSNNNSPLLPKLIGHPWVVKLPSVLPATEFHDFIRKINPFPDHTYKVVYSSWEGKNCSKCLYSISCKGCEIPSDNLISINPRSSIMISYSNLSMDLVDSIEPPDMALQNSYMPAWGWNNRREEPAIDIHECLLAFSALEHLDEQNPWFCPQCKVNRCATKALTVCRFPDYLIVYLKRFVFMENASNKLNNRLRFPKTDLNVSRYVAEEFAGGQQIYDLYSCVCHFGNASAGHYTAFGKNPVNGLWHYYNDETVTAKSPADDEFASAYVLFYAKKGLKSDIPARRNIPTPRPRLNSQSRAEVEERKGGCDSILSDIDSTSVGLGVNGISNGLTVDQYNLNYIVPNHTQQDEQDNSISPSEPSFYHKNTDYRHMNGHSQVSIKLNGVRKDVSNLHLHSNGIDDVRRKSPLKYQSAPSASVTTATFSGDMDVDSSNSENIALSSSDPSYFKKPPSASTTYGEYRMESSRQAKAKALQSGRKNPHPGLAIRDTLEN